MNITAMTLALALNAAPAMPAADPAVAGAPAETPSGAGAQGAQARDAEAEEAAPAPADPAPRPAAGGDIVVSARQPTPADPLVRLNAESYQAIQSVDRAVIGPVAMGYKTVMPRPLRLGLRNALRNLEEPVIALNFLLQLKPGRAAKSVGRFTIDSTVGIAGLIDVARRKPFNLPYVPNGFANTLACYGVGPGPYFFLPLIGPTTLRDVAGVSLDRMAVPAAIGKPFNRPYYAIPANVIDSLNDRIDIDAQLRDMRDNSADPYAATRDLYLKQRKAEIAAICPKKGETPDQTLPPRPGKGRD
ncbi:MAG: VacJ family lipoprotein [Novosphingobium sp.]|jgi:phospholipid-binding lipoprotein MlaA|nr:VacJ family lipoprotein [Novosphingobium sp.]